MFGISEGTQNGENRSTPFSWRWACAVPRVAIPPMPEPSEVPIRSASGAISSPDAATASRAATTANCANRSWRRADLRSSATVGSKPFTSHANRTGQSDAS